MNTILESIVPSLTPFLHLSTPDFLFTAPRRSPEITFIPSIHRSGVPSESRAPWYTGGPPAPVPPRNLISLVTPITSMQKPGHGLPAANDIRQAPRPRT